MAIIKCKMCGGDLKVLDNSSVCECEYCGTRQTVPKADDEKKMTLFTRAARLLRNCEFDKASGVFETVVADFPEEAEAYWGLVLCKYGIEYVDDPATGKKVPTCHRSSFESVLDDPNFEQACEYADAIARRVYREEARQIETLRKGIIEVSGKEDPYDIFISYKETDENNERTLDSVIAQDIYNELTERGYRVFFSRISLESKLGTEYEPYIFAALNSAKVMLVVGTDYENFDAVWVKNEWSRFLKLIASGQKKTLIPVFKNMDAYDMPKEFSKLAAQDMGKVGAMQDLLRGVEKLIPRKKAASAAEETKTVVQERVIVQSESDVKTAAAVKRGNLALEDGEWDSAKEFFNQALSLDAECAMAYFGIALANEKCRDGNAYIQRALQRSPRFETRTVAKDSRHAKDFAKENAVNGFLPEDEISKLYTYTKIMTYQSAVKGYQEIERQEKEKLGQNRNFQRAFRFAQSQEKEELEAFRKKLLDGLHNKVVSAEAEEKQAAERLKKEYDTFIQNADQKAAELHQAAESKRKGFYDQGCELQRNADTVSDYEKAIEAFERTNGYLDSKKRIEECRTQIRNLELAEEKRLEDERREQFYNTAREKQKNAVSISDYRAVIEEYKKAEGYFDSRDQIAFCENRIREIEKIEFEREAAERKFNVALRRTLFAILLILIAGIIVVSQLILPEWQRNKNYKEAIELYEAGSYSEAISILKSLGDFKDSRDKLKEVRAAQKEEQYQRAITLFEEGQFDEAVTVFAGLDGYKDSTEKQNAAKNEASYLKAVSLYEEGRYDEAIVEFTALDGFKDSAEKLIEVRNEFQENQYTAAKKLLDEGSYADAYTAFMKITGYKDVDTLLSTDKNLVAAATAREAKLTPYKTVGGTVTFGTYEQDNNPTNGKEDIEWIVLDVQGEKSLLISKYALDAQAYNSSYTDNTWEKCTLRDWLNSTFLNAAFRADEKAAILTTSVDNSKSQGYSGYNTDGGNDTEDQIFLLSYAEAWKYLSSDSSRTCKPTAYAKAQGAFVNSDNGNCGWWLRSPGNFQSAAASVLTDGSRDYDVVLYSYSAVRPAFWLNLESDIF